jgi:predicted transcriptional regulator
MLERDRGMIENQKCFLDRKSVLVAMVNASVENVKELAKATNLDYTNLSYVIKGRKTTYLTVCKLAKALNTDPDDLIRKEEQA